MMKLMLQRRGVNCGMGTLLKTGHVINTPLQTSTRKLSCNGISKYNRLVSISRSGTALNLCNFANIALCNTAMTSSTSTSHTTTSSKGHHKSNTVSSSNTHSDSSNSSANGNSITNKTHANKVTRYSKLGMDGFTDVKFNAAADAIL